MERQRHQPIIDIPPPPDPPFDIDTFEPIEPPWQAIREWIPADDGEPSFDLFDQRTESGKPVEIPLEDGSILVLDSDCGHGEHRPRKKPLPKKCLAMRSGSSFSQTTLARMKLSATASCCGKSPVRRRVTSALHPLCTPRSPQTPSLPDAGPRSDRFRCGGRESKFLAVLQLRPAPENPVPEKPAELAADDPAWKDAKWVRCHIAEPPADWSSVFLADVSPRDVLGFDPESGKPKTWPLPYSMVAWHAVLPQLPPGNYEVRARSIDMNGFAQPEPRPSLKSGRNPIQVRRFQVT